MKFNKWTLGLAAVGAVSMASAVRADDAPKLSALNTALSSTTISGYVDVAAQYNAGDPGGKISPTGAGYTGAVNQPGYSFNNSGKVDNFSLNNVTVSLDKPEDDSPWASGYHIDLNAGSDAINVGSGNFGVRPRNLVCWALTKSTILFPWWPAMLTAILTTAALWV